MKQVFSALLRKTSVMLPDIPFEVRFWDGDSAGFGKGEPVFVIHLKAKGALRCILGRGATGFREEYVSGNIDITGDLQALMRLGSDETIQGIRLSLWTKLTLTVRALLARNSLGNSPANIARHYDLGNDFYKQYLDESMAYSCAYFQSETDTLEQAQQQKYELICRKLMLSQDDHIIDVGCGWGGFLVYGACKFGVRGTGCTLSKPQADYAKDLTARNGLEKNITILLEDYRTTKGRYDKFVSVGMFEHVGRGFIPLFMDKVKSLLKPGGLGLLHTIGKERETGGDPWTLKYIFPGGYIPVLDHIIRTMGAHGLVPIDIENLRLHYAATLDEWTRRFESKADEIGQMFDDRFVRMWRMYLNGCAATFRWGDLRLYQILFTNGLNNNLPLTRKHYYE